MWVVTVLRLKNSGNNKASLSEVRFVENYTIVNAENWPFLVFAEKFLCLFVLFNSRTAIAGAIIGLLLVFFYFVVMIFVTTI